MRRPKAVVFSQFSLVLEKYLSISEINAQT